MHASSPRDEIARAVAATLDQEARANERRVSLVRLVAYLLVLLLDLWMWAAGARGIHFVTGSLFAVGAAALLFALTRWIPARRWFRFLVPVIDAALIYVLLDSRVAGLGLDPMFISVSALACGLFAASGGLRFDTASAIWTALLAAGLLIALLWPESSQLRVLYSVNAVVAIGLLNVWLTRLVRRAMQAEAGRGVLHRFLPRELVDAAFRAPTRAIGEPRAVEATVLVSDLRGFTSYAETLQPAEVLAFLNEFQGTLAAVVGAHGGTVDKFMGDGMLAVFGAHSPLPDHARRALEAAEGIRAAVAELNHSRAAPLRIGIGVHSGPVVAGFLGQGARLELTVIGDAVNTAARLEALTKEKGADVLVSGETTARAPDRPLVSLGTVVLRGRKQPLEIFTLPSQAIGQPDGRLPPAAGAE